MRPRYERVLLKLSGEALLGNQAFGIDPKMLARLAAERAIVEEEPPEAPQMVAAGGVS